MGRKKSSRKFRPKRDYLMPKQRMFNCPHCLHKNSCYVNLNKKILCGCIECNICKKNFQTMITHLTDPIDIYNEWVDVIRDQRQVKVDKIKKSKKKNKKSMKYSEEPAII